MLNACFLLFSFISSIKKAGTIPIFKNKILMISSLKHENRIVLPKGSIKKDESEVEAAVRETYEESGAIGEINQKLQFEAGNVLYFVLQVKRIDDNFDERNKRERFLLSYQEIMRHSNIIPKTKKMLKKIKDLLED